MYYTTEIDSNDAIKIFLVPADQKIWQTGLYQFKEVLYRTKSVEASRFIPIDEEELRILIDNYVDQYGELPEAQNFLPVDRLNELLNDLSGIESKDVRDKNIQENFDVHKLGKASVHFANDICQFFCSRCHKLFFENTALLDRKYNHYRCPSCRRILHVTPVWVLKDEHSQGIPVTPLPVWVRGADRNSLWDAWKWKTFPQCPKCKSGVLDGYLSLNPARLMETSRIVCSTCNHNFSLYSMNYSLTYASDNLTQAVAISTYSKATLQLGKKDILQHLQQSKDFEVSLVDKFWFSPKTKVKEIVLGYYYGANVQRAYPTRRFGIEMVTGCLYVELKPTYFEESLMFIKKVLSEHPSLGPKFNKISSDFHDFQKMVLHSVAHAILSRIPSICGVSIDSFGYLYDIRSRSVLIYERAPGGFGACSELSKIEEESGESVAIEFFDKLKDDMIRCTCDDRCKYCIALQGCSEWNEALSRFTLGPLLKVYDEEAMTWGF